MVKDSASRARTPPKRLVTSSTDSRGSRPPSTVATCGITTPPRASYSHIPPRSSGQAAQATAARPAGGTGLRAVADEHHLERVVRLDAATGAEHDALQRSLH